MAPTAVTETQPTPFAANGKKFDGVVKARSQNNGITPVKFAPIKVRFDHPACCISISEEFWLGAPSAESYGEALL